MKINPDRWTLEIRPAWAEGLPPFMQPDPLRVIVYTPHDTVAHWEIEIPGERFTGEYATTHGEPNLTPGGIAAQGMRLAAKQLRALADSIDAELAKDANGSVTIKLINESAQEEAGE